MSAILVLVGLLVLAYLGSILVGGRSVRGYGLPSGSEWVLLGLVVGPHFLGTVTRPTLAALEPLALVALAWLALVTGIDYGFVGARRIRVRRLSAAIVLSLGSAVGVAGAFAVYAQTFTSLRGHDLLIACIGVGAVSCETTRYAVRWVVERYAATGPLSDLVADIADGDDVVPLLAITVAFTLDPTPGLTLALPFWGLSLATLGAGALLGALGSALLRVELRVTQTWGIVLGAALFGGGIASRIGSSGLGLCFVLGLALSLLAGRRDELRALVEPSEHSVILPVLVLAGAYVDFDAPAHLGLLIGVVLAARVAVKWTSGALLRLSRGGRNAGPFLGFGLLPSGALAMAFGLAFALRFPGEVGQTVLIVALSVTLFGELFGPTALLFALRRAGEVDAPVSSRLGRKSDRPPAGVR
ncbi:MAG: potassium transporter Kef [Myxococcales bacterium]|nr:potassium transporter Kef [Myxococcales bacterium]